jgi:pimeloyl-ACP methyl ester carboxylesterase
VREQEAGTMSQVSSKDGTPIVYDSIGSGPPVVLVDGALGYRSFGPMPRLAGLLAPHFTVVSDDRRGRGESGDTQPFAVGREVEDIEALIDAAGGSAFLFGISSGACLALEAAIGLGDTVRGLAMYEPPYNADAGSAQEWKDYRTQLAEAVATGRRGDAVALFMALVGVPAVQIGGMRQAPMWAQFEAVAPSLAYDAAAVGEDRGVPLARAAAVTAPALVMNGGAGLAFMRDTATALVKAMPNGQRRELEGQTHDVSLTVLAPVLIEVFRTWGSGRGKASGSPEAAAA